MKKKMASVLVAGAMVATVLPVSAFAATPGAPHLNSVSIAGQSSVSDNSGNLYLTLPSNLLLASQSIGLTATEAVDFVPTEENAANNGELYAASVTPNSASLRFAIDMSSLVPGSDVNFNTPAYSIDLTSADRIQWNGAFNSGFTVNAATLGQALNMTNATLRAGTMVDGDNQGNDTWRIHANFDAANTQLVFYDPSSVMYTVTYNFDGGKYDWRLPAGAPLPEVAIPGNLTLEGWYTDDTYGTAVDFGTTLVTSDMDVYAKTGSASSGGSFLEDLENESATVLHIGSAADFNDFVNHSTEVDPDQRVELTADINLNNASYQAIQFEGDFDGKGHTISNARFTANGSYAGMFSELGATQKIANLTLDNITVSGGTFSGYAGVLAGQVYGVNETPRLNCLVQNVHVKNSSVTGYTVGGLVGFSFASTIRYCSVDNTSVTGLANGGGITGLTYGDIDTCYTDNLSVFALQSRGRGGITGKLLESGKITDCWFTYDQAYGENDRGTMTGELFLDRDQSVSAQLIAARNWANASPDTQPDWVAAFVNGAVNISFAMDTTYTFTQNN